MNKKIKRNRPAEDGRRNDPDLRDQSDIQPGANTISCSNTDNENEQLTKTGADDFRTIDNDDKNADPAFDETNKE